MKQLKKIFAIIAFLLLLMLVYIAVVYWPNIVEGFNRGWNSH